LVTSSPPWQAMLASQLSARTALVGIGNVLRGDDAFGPCLIRQLRNQTDLLLYDGGSTPENWVARIAADQPKRIILVDTADFGAPAGLVQFHAVEEIGPGGVSTHALSLQLFAQSLHERTGASVCLLAVQPRDLAWGAPLSTEVAAALAQVFAVCRAR